MEILNTLLNLLAWSTFASVLLTIFLWGTGLERRLDFQLGKWCEVKLVRLLIGADLILLGTTFFVYSFLPEGGCLAVPEACASARRVQVLNSWFFGSASFAAALIALFVGRTKNINSLGSDTANHFTRL